MTTEDALRALAEARGLVLSAEEAEAVLPPLLDLVREAERLTREEDRFGLRSLDDGAG